MAAEAKGWDISPLEALLPDGDPHAAFDLSAFLRHSAELPEHDLDADFNKLVGLLAGGPTASTAHDQPTPLTDKPGPAAGAPEPLANATLQPSKPATPT